MWTDNIQIKQIDKWLSARTNRIPSGNRDPYTSSMRSASRFISALSGTAESREAQLITDLASAQLYNREKGTESPLAVGLLNRCKQLSIPSDNELAIILTLFLEALRCNNSYYKDIIRFWYEVSKKMPIRELSHNVNVSYIVSYFSVPDKDTGYIPLDDVSDIFAYTNMSLISVSALSDLDISEKAKSGVQKLNDAIRGYTTRSSRAEMFQALDIMFSFDKASTIDSICPTDTNSEGNKLLKTIVGVYSAYFSFSSILYDSNFLKMNIISNSDLKDKPLQQIYYGAPGTGKSHATNEVTSKYPDTVRTTFHPDSDYSTFVGAYKPTTTSVPKYGLNGSNTVPFKDENDKVLMETKIEYKFVKQVFLKAYVKAWKLFKETCVDGGKLAPQFLVIEEINRGNCAQIFGDLFQLLDRKQNFSEYPIEADDDIRKALLEEDTKENPSFGENGLQLSPEQKAFVNHVFDKEGEPSRGVADKICNGQVLVLPTNFYIWATMNTSDQSLFPIDSAFKRRWEWKYVRINEGKDKETGQSLNYRIRFTTLEGEKVDESWWEFIQKINEKIEGATKSEDKKLGYFFCKPDKKANDTDKENTIISAETFVGKVVFYLWQDVFKDYGFKSDIFKKEGNARLAFHDFYPHNIEPDEEKNPEGIDLKLVKGFIDKVMDRKPSVASTDTPAAAPTTE